MTRFSRRRFLQSSAAASAAFSLFTVSGTRASGRVIGANASVRVGVAGINGRGRAHMENFAEQDDVQVTCLIDPDSRLFSSRAKMLSDKYNTDPTCVQDIRKALEDKSIDAVSVATCNHWHSLITIWACQAGKHVYVEKPMSHNVFEGRKCVEAARRYNRVVQHGTQQRSDRSRASHIAAIHSGKYGKLLVAKGFCCKPRWSIGFRPVETPPAEFDFDVWLGPAPKQPFHRNLHPYNWHWFWDFGNGDIGNQGVHEMDVARWGIKDATLPTKVWSLGGRYVPEGKDQGQTPNMLLSVYEFGDVLLVFETRGLVAKEGAPPFKVGNEFHTTEGVIRGWKFYPKNGGDPEPLTGGEGEVTDGGPFGSFIAAVRAGDSSLCNCEAEVAHYSAALCHLGNISYRLGKPVPMQARPRLLGDNPEVVRSFDEIMANLKMVGIPLEDNTYQLGRLLTFDPQKEKFVGDDEANQLLTRPYRDPYVVPDKV